MDSTQHWYEFDWTRPPGLVRMALEWRAPWEYGAALLAAPWLNQLPDGDGHAVIVFPGLMASDASTKPLRNFLKRKGYVAYGWELGSNLGPKDGVMQRCMKHVRAIRRAHRRRVSLIGWSLGGIYARELAKDFAHDVRLVITLGTPFTGHPRATNAWRVYELVTGHRIGAPEIHEPLRVSPSVPTTSIYSRTDGVVAWQCSVERQSDRTENIEVEASHLGLGLNPLAWYAIADRLAQPEGRWKPFDRKGALSWLYRDPTRKAWF
jgi:pimeloyl-ACP methyl ester carboxylesterase